jgi:hypothetical protein
MHVVVMMVVMVVMMMVVMVLHRRGGHRRGGRGFLRDGVAGEANGQSGGDDKALDHERNPLEEGQNRLRGQECRVSPERKMNHAGPGDIEAESVLKERRRRSAWRKDR